MKRIAFVTGLAAIILPQVAAAQVTAGGSASPTPDQPQREVITVIDSTPLGGARIDRDKVPASVQTLSADDFAKTHSISTLDTLVQRIPGVDLGDVQGNDFFQDLHYRGFAASPLQGTPQGIAVYQNGVRINEAFGDTVNWDLIPETAINHLDIWTNNPVFGLNALGGAVNIEMKNGFDWQGFEGEIQGGSYGRIEGSVEYGIRDGNYSFYIAGEGLKDDGWRLQSPSEIARIYADAGYQGDNSEFHIVVSGARSSLGVVGPTPVDLIAQSDNAIFTWPQTTKNEMGMIAFNGRIDIGDNWSIQGNAYGRHLQQKHVDGNDGDFESCSTRSSFGGSLCLEDDAFGTPVGGKTTAFRNQFVILGPSGQTIPFTPNTPYGTVDRTSTGTTTEGGSLQATNDAPLWGHDNNFTFGGSIDHSDIKFSSDSELGFIFPDLSVGPSATLPGSGTFIHTLGNLGYAPVDLGAQTTYYGIYAVDTFDITPQFAATIGVRANFIHIDTNDISGLAPELNGSSSYDHANPMAGLTYKITPDVTVYGGYSRSNRAPTPLEIDCADPVKPCLLENSLVSDPPLKQVVSETYELGLRGKTPIADGRLEWDFGLYRTDSDNDIVSLASVIQGRGYYANVPSTLREGLEIGGQYRAAKWSAYANYSYIYATYQFSGDLASPNNPAADANGNIHVSPGDRLPGMPPHQFKVGADYFVTPEWKIGGDLEAFGSQYFVGDDANQNAKLAGYWIANVRTSYQITPNIQIFGIINNLFDKKYATYGTYFETDSVAGAISTPLNDPRSITLAQPISGYGGVKVSF